MRCILDDPSPEFPGLGRTVLASWIPWRYYLVQTVGAGFDPLSPIEKLTAAISGKAPEPWFTTQVCNCDRMGLYNSEKVWYEREYATLDEARAGHRETVEALLNGRMPPRQVGEHTYPWTRWAAPGGQGYSIIEWVAIGVGIAAAILTFRVVPHWWLALPLAALAYYAGTILVAVLWARVRLMIERCEGIRW
jgi:hypothetical protein